jgi:hypothetical protein
MGACEKCGMSMGTAEIEEVLVTTLLSELRSSATRCMRCRAEGAPDSGEVVTIAEHGASYTRALPGEQGVTRPQVFDLHVHRYAPEEGRGTCYAVIPIVAGHAAEAMRFASELFPNVSMRRLSLHPYPTQAIANSAMEKR